MGREFLNIFEYWAEGYDDIVHGSDPQYAAVFSNYDAILDEVVNHSRGTVLEFGVGTGNLSEKLLSAGRKVIGIEPSQPMRELAMQKLPALNIQDGDFIDFPSLTVSVQSIVSTYAFHHLTDSEKAAAMETYAEILPENGRIVFADTMFETEAILKNTIRDAKDKGFHDLTEDLEREHYPTIGVLENIFIANKFDATFTQMNDFVWLVTAYKG